MTEQNFADGAPQEQPQEQPQTPGQSADWRVRAQAVPFPIFWFPTRWPMILSLDLTPPPDLPGNPHKLLRRIFAMSTPVLLVGSTLATILYLCMALVPLVLGNLLDTGLDSGLSAELFPGALQMLGLILTFSLVSWAQHAMEVAGWLSGAKRVSRATGHKTGLQGRAVTKEISTGDVITTVANDGDYIGATIFFIMTLIGAAVSVVVVSVLMLRVSIPLGLLVLIGMPVVLGIVTLVAKPLQERMKLEREENGRLSTITTDAVAGLRVLRGIGGEDSYSQIYREQSTKVREAGVKVASTIALLTTLQTGMPGLFSVIVVSVSAMSAINGHLTVGELVTFYGYTSFLVGPLSTATELIHMSSRAWVSFKKVASLMDVQPLVSDDAVTDTDLNSAGDLVDETSGVRFVGGKITALVCREPRKSAALATRLGRENDADGTITLGGTDLRHLSVETARETVQVSGAHAEIFAGTLAEAVLGAQAPLTAHRDVTAILLDQVEIDEKGSETLMAGDGNLQLSAEQETLIQHSLEVAVAADVLDSVQGLYGAIGEKGRTLSGGQRQRLALARAVAARPPVLVLIEPTSAVDSHTEELIAERLSAERRGQTTVIVTASPLVLDHCDEVVLIDAEAGTELARGPHRHLSETSPDYLSVVHRFQGDEDDDAGQAPALPALDSENEEVQR